MEQPTPTGAESLTVDQAAERISGLLNPKPPKQEAEAPAETQPEPDAEQPEVEAEAESPKEAEKESQALTFEHLQELAEALETPIDDLMGKVKARVKISGVERDVTLAELRDGYQMESDYRKKTSELSEQRKALDAERERLTQELNGRLAEAGQMTEFMERQLLAEYQSIDWTALRTSDPAEFAARKQEYNERYNAIQGLKHQALQNWQKQQAELQEKSKQEHSKVLQEEQQRLIEKIPDFADPIKAKALTKEIGDYLKDHGFRDEELANIWDHRQILVIRDAMKYRALQSKKPEVTSKVKEVPKLLKPGAKPPADAKAGLREKIARLKKTGRVEDAAAAIALMRK